MSRSDDRRGDRDRGSSVRDSGTSRRDSYSLSGAGGAGVYSCANCRAVNYSSHKKCHKCGEPNQRFSARDREKRETKRSSTVRDRDGDRSRDLKSSSNNSRSDRDMKSSSSRDRELKSSGSSRDRDRDRELKSSNSRDRDLKRSSSGGASATNDRDRMSRSERDRFDRESRFEKERERERGSTRVGDRDNNTRASSSSRDVRSPRDTRGSDARDVRSPRDARDIRSPRSARDARPASRDSRDQKRDREKRDGRLSSSSSSSRGSNGSNSTKRGGTSSSRDRIRSSSGSSSEWYCSSCQERNRGSSESCRKCSKARKDSRRSSSGSSSSLRGGTGTATAATAAPNPVEDLTTKKKRHINKIRQIDGKLKIAEESLATLQRNRTEAVSRSLAADRALMTIRMRAITERLTEENAQIAARAHAESPVVVKVEIGAQIDVSEMPCIKKIMSEAPKLKAKVEKWVRDRKLVLYKRSRVLGETWAKTQPMWFDARRKEVLMSVGGGDSAFMSPNTGTIRLDNDAAFQDVEIDDARFDETLAPLVSMVMDAGLEGKTHTFKDDNYRVHDPLQANLDWQQRQKWNDNERNAFLRLYRKHNKKFHVISTMAPFHARDVAPKSTRDIVAFYYANKHKMSLKQLGPGGVKRKSSHLHASPRNSGRRGPATPNMPRELLNLGITSDEEFVAYLVGQNTTGRRRRNSTVRQGPQEAPPSPPRIVSAKKRKKKAVPKAADVGDDGEGTKDEKIEVGEEKTEHHEANDEEKSSIQAKKRLREENGEAETKAAGDKGDEVASKNIELNSEPTPNAEKKLKLEQTEVKEEVAPEEKGTTAVKMEVDVEEVELPNIKTEIKEGAGVVAKNPIELDLT